jgi:hypothetical protein
LLIIELLGEGFFLEGSSYCPNLATFNKLNISSAVLVDCYHLIPELELTAKSIHDYPTPLIDPLVRHLRYDVEFPDLYFLGKDNGRELFRDYLGLKIRRMGYNPSDLSRLDPSANPATNE